MSGPESAFKLRRPGMDVERIEALYYGQWEMEPEKRLGSNQSLLVR
jgi:hypothetical protein